MKIFYQVMILVVMVGGSAVFLSVPAEAGVSHEEHGKSVYYCPMHPNYTADKPGSCPICGMDLVKKVPAASAKTERQVKFYRNPMDPSVTSPVPMKDGMGMDYVPVYEKDASSSPGVQINMDKQQLIGVRMDEVKTRPLVKNLRLTGRAVLDQELYDAQKVYADSSTLSSAYWNPARQKLVLLGMGDEEIQELRKRRRADQSLIAFVPVQKQEFYQTPFPDTVWVYAAVFENEMALVKPGQRVDLAAIAYPGESFEGIVAGVGQSVDPQTRTVRVRIRVEDKARRLKPEMFVTVTIQVDLKEALSVPAAAVLDSGKRKIVYVVTDQTTFAPREVVLGSRAGEFFEVKKGLKSGDKVVVGGNFLVDAESRLKGIFDEIAK